MGSLKVELVPIFDDNYVFVLVDEDSASCVIVDPGEGLSVREFLSEKKLTPLAILLTHHHADHIGGTEELLAQFQIPAYAPALEIKKMPFATTAVSGAQNIKVGPFRFQVIDLPGHTLGHIAYWEERRHWLFSGDVLFGLGCGRVFEGTYAEMFESLQKIKSLPDETLVFCTHEYTEMNLKFCKRLSPADHLPLVGDDENLEIYENQLRARRSVDLPSVPLKLGIEKRVNPFLMAKKLEVFSELRDLRNKA